MPIQAVLFRRGQWTSRSAESWLSRHGLRPIKKTREGHFWHYRIRRPIFIRYSSRVVYHHFPKKGDAEIHLIIGANAAPRFSFRV